MTEFQESVEAAQPNPPIDALDRVSDNDETDSALSLLANDLMGIEPAQEAEPAEKVEEDKAEAKADPEEDKKPPVKVKIGDEELPLDEVVSGYMKDKDYRQKTQALAEERRKIAAWEQHIKNLESDPNYVAHVRAYHQKLAEAQAPKPPDDPIEAIKWEAAEAAKREILKELAPQLQHLQAKQAIDSVKAQVMRDPLFDETQAAILRMVENQPTQRLRDQAFAILDSDPNEYAAAYADARKWVEAQKAQKATKDTQPAEKKDPEPVARRERAPLLESAGRTVPTASEESNRTKRLSEINKSLKQGQGIDDDTLFEYFDLKGITAKLT